MAASLAPEAAGGPGVEAGPAPVVLSWPLPDCRPDSLTDLFSPRALAELARVAGPAGGAAVLELGGHTLQAPASGKRGKLQLLEGRVPPAGLTSLALRNGTLALRPGMGVAFSSKQPFAVSLEGVKLVRPAPTGGSGTGSREVLAHGNTAMVSFMGGAVSGRMVQCRVELSPAGTAGDSALQVSVGVFAQVCRVAGGRVGHAGRRAGRRGGVPGGGAAGRRAGWRDGVPDGGAACRAAGGNFTGRMLRRSRSCP
jgi:hypothetical protein